MGGFERELFLEFWKTLRCLWFCRTKTYHKVLAHPSHPLAVHVDTFRGRLHTASSGCCWIISRRSSVCVSACVLSSKYVLVEKDSVYKR